MPAQVVIYQIQGHGRSLNVCEAIEQGIIALGDYVSKRWEHNYRGVGEEDVAVFYGLAGLLPKVFRDYPAAGKKAVYIDLGYWGRHHNGNRMGYHKFAINGRHP